MRKIFLIQCLNKDWNTREKNMGKGENFYLVIPPRLLLHLIEGEISIFDNVIYKIPFMRKF
jgi:hypothetical protein